MELMDTCLGKLLTQLKPNPFPEDVIGKVVIAVVTALDYLKTNFSVIHRGVYVYLCVCLSIYGYIYFSACTVYTVGPLVIQALSVSKFIHLYTEPCSITLIECTPYCKIL